MNWSKAICAVASCIATRSGLKSTYDLPRSYDEVASPWVKWAYRIFSVRVSGFPNALRAAAIRDGKPAYTFLIISISKAIFKINLLIYNKLNYGIQGVERYARYEIDRFPNKNPFMSYNLITNKADGRCNVT